MPQKEEINPVLLEDAVGVTLIRMVTPTLFAVIERGIFNIADTFFISRLGSEALSALSFTFPVVLFYNNLSIGISAGSSIIVSKTIGSKDFPQAQQLANNSLLLGFLTSLILLIIGLIIMDPLFHLLGATNQELLLIKQYMTIWFWGLFFVIVPKISNALLRALGDMKTPGLVITMAVLLNIILDPLLIFGLGPFPRMGISGAALATVISRSVTFFIPLWKLWSKEKLIKLNFTNFSTLFSSWRQIFYLGIPISLTKIIAPLAMGIIVNFVSFYGSVAVVAFGIASRFEFFILAFIRSLGIALRYFLGQNWGAKLYKRSRSAIKWSINFSLIFGLSSFILLLFIAPHVAAIFTDDCQVITNVNIYFRFIALGYGFYGILLISTEALNVLKRPFHSLTLNIIQLASCTFMASVASNTFGLKGIFGAIMCSYFLSGLLANLSLKKVLRQYK